MKALPAGLAELLPAYLARQRWYGGTTAEDLVVVDSDVLTANGAGEARLWWALITAGGAEWQLLLGERPNGGPAEFLHGHDEAVVGRVGARDEYTLRRGGLG